MVQVHPVYKKAINQDHEINLQISDCFHIFFKHLTSYPTDVLRRIVKKRIPVALTETEIEEKTMLSTKTPSRVESGVVTAVCKHESYVVIRIQASQRKQKLGHIS